MKKSPLFVFIILIKLIYPSLGFADNSNIVEKIQQGALLVDVRTVREFESGALPNAINIPLSQLEQHLDLFQQQNNQPIILYCRSGRRSGIAKKILDKYKIENTYNGGGYRSLLLQLKQAR